MSDCNPKQRTTDNKNNSEVNRSLVHSQKVSYTSCISWYVFPKELYLLCIFLRTCGSIPVQNSFEHCEHWKISVLVLETKSSDLDCKWGVGMNISLGLNVSLGPTSSQWPAPHASCSGCYTKARLNHPTKSAAAASRTAAFYNYGSYTGNCLTNYCVLGWREELGYP